MTDFTKVIVIGLDGATFDIIQPMAARGELPAFARLMAEGVWGTLQSTTPPVSPQAWSSFLTGLHPGRHGVFGFLGKPQGRFYRRPILTSRDIKAPTLLQVAGEAGRRVAAFGVPMTYPPFPVNGVLIPEQHGPPLSHPSHLWKEMVAAVGDPRDLATHIPYLFTQDKRGYVNRQRELLEIQRRAVHWHIDRELYDLFIVVFTTVDRSGHFLWKYMDTNHPDHRPEWAETLGDALPDLYRRLDTIVGELWERLGPKGTIVVMSDHGFGPLQKRVFVNRWLWEHEYLMRRPLIHRLASIRYPWPLLRLYNGIARRLGLPHVALPIGPWRKPIDPQLYEPRFYFDAHLQIDWPRTKAFCSGSDEQGVYINVKGREPTGVVAPGVEYESLRGEIREGMLSITDPEDGQSVVERVLFREEVYSGSYLQCAPDLVVRMRDESYVLSPELFVSEVVIPARHRSGTHRPKGILLLAGEPIQAGFSFNDAAIVDLAPTILHLLGVPVPEHIEGRVLEKAFTPEWRATYPVHRVAFAGEDTSTTDMSLSPEEAAAIEDHLRGLGYIG